MEMQDRRHVNAGQDWRTEYQDQTTKIDHVPVKETISKISQHSRRAEAQATHRVKYRASASHQYVHDNEKGHS